MPVDYLPFALSSSESDPAIGIFVAVNILVVLVMIVGFVAWVAEAVRKGRQVDTMRDAALNVRKGTPISFVISALGGDYELRRLSNGESRYTWKVHYEGKTCSCQGIRYRVRSSRTYRIAVYEKGGVVVRVSQAGLY